jgi:hypothetical protein
MLNQEVAQSETRVPFSESSCGRADAVLRSVQKVARFGRNREAVALLLGWRGRCSMGD